MNEDTTNLNSALLEQLKIREKSNQLSQAAIDLENTFLESIKKETDVKNQIETLDSQILKLKQLELKTNDKSLKILIDQYSKVKGVLSLLDKKKDKTAEIKELLDDTKDSLLETLGLSKEMFKNGIAFGLGMFAAKKGAEMLTSAFESTVGQAKEMYKTFGASVKESARVGMEVGKASFSMTGLIYGSESVAESANDIANYFNSTAAISSDTLKNVTELSALMGDGAGAVRMNTILKSVDDKAIDITDNIKDIATKSGVTAASVFKEMDKQAGKLLGKSEKEIEIIAKQTAAMVKLGVTKENLATVSESVLDIENSIAAQNKARLFGVEMNSQAIRDAAVAYQYGGGSAEDFAKAIAEQVGSAEEFGKMAPGIQKIYANQIGMTTDEITDMLLKQEELRKNTEKYGEDGAKTVAKIKEGFGGAKSAILASLPALAQSTTFLKNMGMDTSKLGGFFSKLNPANLFKGMPTPDLNMDPTAPKPNVEIPKGDDVNPLDKSKTKRANVKGKGGSTIGKTIGSLGSGVGTAMKGIAKGFAAFGNFQTMAGVAVITGAIIGLGFALKLAAPGIEAIGKAIATVIGGIGDFIVKIAQIASPEVASGLLGLALGFTALSASLATFAIMGVAAIPAMTAVGIFTAAMTTLGVESSPNTKQSDPLLEEIKGLRADIKAQPINVVLNNKIVGEINRASRASNSYVNK